jgi:hypothetical protein
MLTFRPIVYDTADLRAFKYTGTSAVREGKFCCLAASTTRHQSCCTPMTAAATLPTTSGTVDIYNTGKFFPIYREDPDVENVGATISQNDEVLGMQLKSGSEFEVHKSAIAGASVVGYTAVGMRVGLTATGLIAPIGTLSVTGAIIGEVVGTFNATWLRVRAY